VDHKVNVMSDVVAVGNRYTWDKMRGHWMGNCGIGNLKRKLKFAYVCVKTHQGKYKVG
jgi:hypothetical protein